MRSQEHNKGKLKELRVSIEEEVVETIERMSKQADMPIEEIVVIALKRFCSSHADYENKAPVPR